MAGILNGLRSLCGVLLCFGLLLIFASLASISSFSSLFVRITLCFGMVFWFLLQVLKGFNTPFPRQLDGFILLCLAFFLIWLVVQGVAQWYHLEPFFPYVASWDERINLFIMFATGIGFYCITSGIIRSRIPLLFFIQFLIFLSAAAALYLIYIALISSNPRYFWEMSSLPLIESLRPWVGSSIYPNYFVKLLYPGAFYSVSLIFYIYTLRHDIIHPPNLYSWLLLNLCFACVLIGAIFLTQSRAGIIAFVAAFFLYSVFFTFSHEARRSALKRFGLLFVMVLLFLLCLGLKHVIRELQTVASAFFGEMELKGIRGLTIGAGWQLVKTNGLWGVGLGNYQMGWLYHHKPPFDYLPGTTFNDLIWLWAETGIPGFFCFFAAFLSFGIRGLIRVVRTESYFVSYFLLASICSLLALLFHSFVDPTFYVSPLLWLSVIVLGIGVGCFYMTPWRDDNIEEQKAEKSYKGKIINFILALTVFLLTLAAGIISVNKMYAFILTKASLDEALLKKAGKLDPLNPIYQEWLAHTYFKKYRRYEEASFLKQAFRSIDKAISLDRFRLSLDTERAEMLFDINDLKGVRETFQRMSERLPNFYLAEYTASVFYMEHALQSKDPDRSRYLEELAIKHYKKLIVLFPQFPEAYKLYPFGSEAAHHRYLQLKEEGRI